MKIVLADPPVGEIKDKNVENSMEFPNIGILYKDDRENTIARNRPAPEDSRRCGPVHRMAPAVTRTQTT